MIDLSGLNGGSCSLIDIPWLYIYSLASHFGLECAMDLKKDFPNVCIIAQVKLHVIGARVAYNG